MPLVAKHDIIRSLSVRGEKFLPRSTLVADVCYHDSRRALADQSTEGRKVVAPIVSEDLLRRARTSLRSVRRFSI